MLEFSSANSSKVTTGLVQMRCIQGQSDFPFIRPQEHVEAGLRPLRENDYSELPNMFFPATFTKRSCLRAHEATRRRRRPLRFLRLNDFFRRPPAGAFPIRRRGNCYGARRRPGRDLMSRRSLPLPAAAGSFVTELLTFISQLTLAETEQTGGRLLADSGI